MVEERDYERACVYLAEATQLIQRAAKLTMWAKALIEGTGGKPAQEDGRPGILGDIPMVKGSDMAGDGGNEVGKLNIHDSILKGDDA